MWPTFNNNCPLRTIPSPPVKVFLFQRMKERLPWSDARCLTHLKYVSTWVEWGQHVLVTLAPRFLLPHAGTSPTCSTSSDPPILGHLEKIALGDCCATALPDWENWWTWENCTKNSPCPRVPIFASLPWYSCCRAVSYLSPFSHEYLSKLPQLKHLLTHLPHKGEIILWTFQHPSLPLCCQGSLHHQHCFAQNSSYFVLTIHYNTGCHPMLE